MQLEAAFAQNPQGSCKLCIGTGDLNQYTIQFSTMKQQKDNTKFVRSVRRIPSSPTESTGAGVSQALAPAPAQEHAENVRVLCAHCHKQLDIGKSVPKFRCPFCQKDSRNPYNLGEANNGAGGGTGAGPAELSGGVPVMCGEWNICNYLKRERKENVISALSYYIIIISHCTTLHRPLLTKGNRTTGR